MLNIGPSTVIKKRTDLHYYLADSTGKRFKHSFHLNRLQLWRDALITAAITAAAITTRDTSTNCNTTRQQNPFGSRGWHLALPL